MAHAQAQAQPGRQTQQQQALQARLDDPLVSEDFRGEIRDMNDYFALKAAFAAQRNDGHAIAPLSQDPNKNFPDNDPVRQRQLVRDLFEAMRNQTDILDGTVKKDENKQVVRDANGEPVKRENGAIRRSRDDPNIHLELLAWDFLLGIRDAQLGPLYALKWAWGRNFVYQYFDSFIDRYNAALESIKISKKAVADLMEPSWVCRLANAPDHEVQRKKGNKRGNGNKQALLEEAHSKRKRDREEQEHKENDDEIHEAASHSTSGTPTVSATPEPRRTRKQPKRSASDTPRRAAANSEPAAAPPSGQSTILATPQVFTREAEAAPRMTTNDFYPTAVPPMGPAGPQIDPEDRIIGPTNEWNPSFGAIAYPSAEPETTSSFLQGPPQGFTLHQLGHPDQTFSQNASGQAFNLAVPVLGNHQTPAYGNNNHFLPQANILGAQFLPQTIPPPCIVPSLNTFPEHISSFPTSPLSSGPQTPWAAETPEFASPEDLRSAPDSQKFARMWDAHMSFFESEGI